MPLFYDQYDNAQRVQEKNFGVRVEPYSFKDEELVRAIDQVLNDKELKQKLTKASERIRASKSKEKACVEMEKVAEKFRK